MYSHTCMHTEYTCTYTSTHTYTRMHAHTHTCYTCSHPSHTQCSQPSVGEDLSELFVYRCVCVCVCVCVCICVCTCVCVYLCMCMCTVCVCVFCPSVCTECAHILMCFVVTLTQYTEDSSTFSVIEMLFVVYGISEIINLWGWGGGT